MGRRVCFKKGPELAVCLETGAPVAPLSMRPDARALFTERAKDKAAFDAAMRQLTKRFARLRLDDGSPDVDMVDATAAAAVDAEMLDAALPQGGGGGAGAAADADEDEDEDEDAAAQRRGGMVVDAEAAREDMIIRRRVQLAVKKARALSRDSIADGCLDFAFHVCRGGSKLHRRLLGCWDKYRYSTKIGTYNGDERRYAVAGDEAAVTHLAWYAEYTTAMSAQRAFEVQGGELK
ncbi:hypothetical protein JDV02_008867 [Purpureocillium takamizusanense]|uniref:Uncharacterized protein n=1 Tax=Purpureocillium takamizusanense TaxID=2060973 RepID=A0A9Q8QQP8_9HYPO|nr:uncharacterized protein JDV02_008867 [Purpureocillium takamizusanense]UNI23024.1 hypothetical protein JDV02_008867 [Purpureocillium takamizusanense]